MTIKDKILTSKLGDYYFFNIHPRIRTYMMRLNNWRMDKENRILLWIIKRGG